MIVKCEWSSDGSSSEVGKNADSRSNVTWERRVTLFFPYKVETEEKKISLGICQKKYQRLKLHAKGGIKIVKNPKVEAA